MRSFTRFDLLSTDFHQYDGSQLRVWDLCAVVSPPPLPFKASSHLIRCRSKTGTYFSGGSCISLNSLSLRADLDELIQGNVWAVQTRWLPPATFQEGTSLGKLL